MNKGDLIMKVEVYKREPGDYNLENYNEAYQNFDWKEIEKSFSWYETGKMNMAYECIDRHVDNGKGEKIALNYKDEKSKESYNYSDLKKL